MTYYKTTAEELENFVSDYKKRTGHDIERQIYRICDYEFVAYMDYDLRTIESNNTVVAMKCYYNSDGISDEFICAKIDAQEE